MSKIQRFIVIPILLCALLLPFFCLNATALSTDTPSLSAESAILLEAESATVICEKNADCRLPMASTTKIMTALTALSLSAPDTEICIDAKAVGIEGSSIYLTEGERLTLEQLLYALLLESANDAAAAIAIGLCGSIKGFADEMNLLADKFSLKDTHFTNPHGLDDPDHYTTAKELALLTRYALQNDLIQTIVGTRKTTIPHASTEGYRLLINHNKLLRLYDGCIGVKTGFTKRSGRCLVSAAQKDGVTLIAVTLNAPNDWNDHTSLFNYGFSRYESITLCKAEKICHMLPVVGGNAESVMLCNTAPLCKVLPVNRGEISFVIEAPHFAYADVVAGEIQGKVVFYCDIDGDGKQERIGSIELVACSTVSKNAPKSFWQRLLAFFGIN